MPKKSGGALLYIRDTINHKLRPDPESEKEKGSESIFIEILHKTSKNVIIGYIYRQPCMHPKEFNDLHLKSLTERFTNTKENNTIGWFQQWPYMKSNSNATVSEFLDAIYSSNLLPNITSPTWLTRRIHTLIDNIISNIDKECTLGNIINTISNYLGKLLIIPNCSYSYRPGHLAQTIVSLLHRFCCW